MANLITTPVELGFTDFVGKLISDTFEAVISSQANQEEQWLQLQELLSLDLAEFSKRVIDDDVVDSFLTENFPDGKDNHLIKVGIPYQRSIPQRGVAESPPINSMLGYQPNGKKLTNIDVSTVKDAVRLVLAEKQFSILQSLVNKGSTRVLVEGGKINAKMTFSILQVDKGEDSTGSATPPTSPNLGRNLVFMKRNVSFGNLVKTPELRNVHFFIKPTTDQDPQTSTVKANVYSEVEIHFKTVS